MQKYKYTINNLDCADCARELEEMLNKRDDFSEVVVNFNTCKFSYKSDIKYSIDELNKIIKSVEPDAFLSDNNEVDNKPSEYHLSVLILGVILGFIGYFIKEPNYLKICLYVISYSLLLYKLVINAFKLLIKGNINENALIVISSVGALLLGEVMEGILVVMLYTIGKILEEKAINKSRSSIKNILDIKEPYAYKVNGKDTLKVLVEDVSIGDILVVKKGEKIPIDGIVIKGKSLIDTSNLTGESELLEVGVKDAVLSGYVNMGDVIQVKATHVYKDSAVAKILEMLDSATDKKTKTETMVTKISKVYTPIIMVLALLIVIVLPLVFNTPINTSIYRALTFLVISCPCAIAISVPLAYFTGIGTASKNGILIKGSNYLDGLSEVNNIIFDKTGTLTNGTFVVKDILISDDNYKMDEIIDILVKGESFSNHPIASSILKLKKNDIDTSCVKDFKEIEGKGITFTLNGKKVLIGNNKLCDCDNSGLVHLHINGAHIASVLINDGIKPHAKEVIDELKKRNIKTYMFTGDKESVAKDIASMLGIDEVKYEMLPNDKYEAYEVVSKKGFTIFVGDGVNDAPTIKRADIGISLGGIGSDSAVEASDIVLMQDELECIPKAINISVYTKRIVKQNLIMAMSVKILILLLSVFGMANMWMAVISDTGVTLLTVLNTLRILRKF